ncbi:MFS transporter [Anaerobacillus arseniciselenatis]|uniref:MFS transporter n=1 Tax=Anaerobacillus arseniciselenatis TaxID=85682 RepID=A0A1S2LVA5_9BACI|nr:MFS transporter [Anaerobacillus arseniciselenatis]OIJ15587.1 MFS transporter [Anaerobacillus arseniciselenatis]
MKNNRCYALFWISIAQLFALSLWFSATVIIPDLKLNWTLSPISEALITASVPLGFIFGAFFSAYFGLADRFNARKIFALSAIIGAAINGLLIFSSSALIAILLRFFTGVTLAGVYPIAVKLLALWFPKKRGLAIGILIAALTLGSALPHFIVIFFANFHWQSVIITSSLMAIFASVIMYFIVKDAPTKAKKTVVSLKLLKEVVKNKPVMLANYGYFGHMWELYAMWTWLPAFFTASFFAFSNEVNPALIALSSFLSIGVAGAIGCIVGGYYADKIGRSRLTVIAMFVSGLCAILIGFTFGQATWITIVVAMVWGVFVIADSAQFSAAVTDFAEGEYIGTALTFQMCIGFAVTIVTIQIIPLLASYIGWQWVFSLLSIGPFFGILSMLKLRRFELKETIEN